MCGYVYFIATTVIEDVQVSANSCDAAIAGMAAVIVVLVLLLLMATIVIVFLLVQCRKYKHPK